MRRRISYVSEILFANDSVFDLAFTGYRIRPIAVGSLTLRRLVQQRRSVYLAVLRPNDGGICTGDQNARPQVSKFGRLKAKQIDRMRRPPIAVGKRLLYGRGNGRGRRKRLEDDANGCRLPAEPGNRSI